MGSLKEVTIEVINYGEDFIGSLRTKLEGLSGFRTMALELIQNAEDAGASSISFNFQENELVIENDSEFTKCQDLNAKHCPKIKNKEEQLADCDFHRISLVSSGEKGEEEGTIGIFGIGFVSVYQVTDRPILLSSGKKWTFMPEEREIKSENISTRGTTFILPWAKTLSKLRELLKISPVQPQDICGFEKDLREVLPDALLFLKKKLACINMLRNGQKILTVQRKGHRDSGEVRITWDDGSLLYKVFKAKFERPASPQIEKKKEEDVFIAIPQESGRVKGCLFSFLPTQITTGFPFHINADFYPTPERKGVVLDGTGHKVEWNRRAIKRVEELLAESLLGIRDTFGYKTVFECLKSAKEKEKDPLWEGIWPTIKGTSMDLPIVFTYQENWEIARRVFLLQDMEKEGCFLPIAEALGLPFDHADLRSYFSILTALGAKPLKVEHLLDAIDTIDLSPGTPLKDAPSPLNSEQNLRIIYEEFDTLITRIKDQEQRDEAEERVSSLPLGLSIHKRLYPLRMLRRASEEDQETFKFLGEKVRFAYELDRSDTILVKIIPSLGVENALELLKGLTGNDFNEAYTCNEDSFDPMKVYQFFAKHLERFDRKERLREQFLDIPMFRVHEEFRALRHLSLPGNFKDPLELDILIQEKLDGTVTDFLKAIGVKELDLVTYVKKHILGELRSKKVSKDRLRKLVDELSKGLSCIRDDQEAIKVLRDCPVVECDDGEFRKGNEVYFGGQDLGEILGEGNYRYVSYPEVKIPDSYREFYCAIGVGASLRPQDIVKRVEKIIEDPPTPEARKKIEKIFLYLSNSWDSFNETQKRDFSELKELEWLPEEGNTTRWCNPCDLFLKVNAHLFESQGHFLEFQGHGKFPEYLGLKEKPPVKQVVKHLLYCSEKNSPLHPEIYCFLSRYCEDPSIKELGEKKCVYISGNFVEPNKVYWQEHFFGNYRYRLGEDSRDSYKFFEAVGVKETPDVDDYINFLLEISEGFGSQNKALDEDTYKVLYDCFAYLQREVLDEKVAENSLEPLKKKKVIPQVDKVLYVPARVFFKDKSGIVEKFEGHLKENVIPKDTKTWQLFERLGVRPLSAAVEYTIKNIEDPIPDQSLTCLVKGRRKSFKRVIAQKKKQIPEGWHEEVLEELKVLKVKKVEVICYLPEFDDWSFPSCSERVHLCPSKKELYVQYESEPPWRDIARELSLVLNPIIDLCDLGPIFKEILQANTSKEAERILDQYGFDLPPSVPTEDEVEEIRLPPSPPQQPHGGENYGPPPEVVTPSQQTHKDLVDRGRLGEARALEYLKSKKKEEYPLGDVAETESEFIISCEGKNIVEVRWLNKGEDMRQPYDIMFVENDNEHFIEVKSTKGEDDWFYVTKNQLEFMQEKREKFFIYRIYNVEQPQAQVRPIPDPYGCWERGEIKIKMCLQA